MEDIASKMERIAIKVGRSQKDAIETIFQHYMDIEQENFFENSSKVDKGVFASEFKSHIFIDVVRVGHRAFIDLKRE